MTPTETLTPYLPLFENKKRLHAFAEFHRENPGVFRLFHKFAQQAKDAGRKRFGAHAIGERIRWFTQIETSDEDFKLNDHHLPYYSRLLMLKDPKTFEGFFSIRDTRFDATEVELLRVLDGTFAVVSS